MVSFCCLVFLYSYCNVSLLQDYLCQEDILYNTFHSYSLTFYFWCIVVKNFMFNFILDCSLHFIATCTVIVFQTCRFILCSLSSKDMCISYICIFFIFDYFLVHSSPSNSPLCIPGCMKPPDIKLLFFHFLLLPL